MRIGVLFISTCLFTCTALAENLVLMNGTIIDGTGKPRVIGNVRIRDGKIADIGALRPAAGETLLDVKGMIVAPGFIDLETVSAAELEKDLGAASEISQGITTVILGSDGTGPYSVEEHMLPYDEKPPAVNIAMLVGHTTVRRQIMGPDYKRPATADEISRMAALVEDAMRQGAFGLASDLRKEPASFSTTDELLALARALGRFGGTFFVHPRDDGIKEALDVARDTKVPLQLSLEMVSAAVLADIDKARMQGIDIGAQVYGFAEPGRDLRALLQNPSISISLAQYLRDDKAMTLERAIQKAAGLPASRLSLKERGALRKGVPADIVVFNPMNPAGGPRHIFVNGTLVLRDGQPTDARPGQALR
jgi:N-acyl-D-amino-acid deacylase